MCSSAHTQVAFILSTCALKIHVHTLVHVRAYTPVCANMAHAISCRHACAWRCWTGNAGIVLTLNTYLNSMALNRSSSTPIVLCNRRRVHLISSLLSFTGPKTFKALLQKEDGISANSSTACVLLQRLVGI